MSRKSRRKAKREAQSNQAQPPANVCEKRAPSSLTPRRLKFALAWAEADPEDRLQDVAIRAGYSESVAKSGMVAELCRDPEVIKLRDQRLRELQDAAQVTVEETLIGLRDLARDPLVPPKDRVAARKALLDWYARNKGQHASPAPPPAPAGDVGSRVPGRDAKRFFEQELFGVSLDEDEANVQGAEDT